MSNDTIDIKGLDRLKLLQALYDGTRALGLGFLYDRPSGLPEGIAVRYEPASSYIDYCEGRPIKSDLSKDEVDPWAYDRDAGTGAFAAAVDRLREDARASGEGA